MGIFYFFGTGRSMARWGVGIWLGGRQRIQAKQRGWESFLKGMMILIHPKALLSFSLLGVGR